MRNLPSNPEAVKESVVSFIDILGFRNKIKNWHKSSNPELHYRNVALALGRISRYQVSSSLYQRVSGSESNVKFAAFSDSIIISATCDYNGMLDVIGASADLACQFLAAGFFCRGGIAQGLTYHNDTIIFGLGPVRAYELERQGAYYPRIVLSDEIAQEVEPALKSRNPLATIAADHDGVRYVDVITTLYTKSEDVEDLKRIKEMVEKEIVRSQGIKHASRWFWMASKFNAVLGELAVSSVEEIDQNLLRGDSRACGDGDG